MLKGIPVSDGYAVSKIYKYENESIDLSKKIIKSIPDEILFYEKAISKTIYQLETLKENTKKQYGDETAKIFEAHMMIADDIEIKKQVIDLIHKESCNFIYALHTVVSRFALLFSKMEDTYLKERAYDIMDVSSRIIKNALNIEELNLSHIDEQVIICAHEITPSEAASMNPKYIKGVCTEVGGKTSHGAIMLRMMGIPAISSIHHLMQKVKNHQEVILDGYSGILYVNFNEHLKRDITSKIDVLKSKERLLKAYIGKKTLTYDQQPISLYANIGSSKDLEYVKQYDGEGIGLYRTELLYIDQKMLPSLDFQIEEYRMVLKTMYPKPVIIRTLDIGGDKKLSYLKLEKEDNPYLGKRGIRLSFEWMDIFKTQIKALLLANTKGNLKIMFPMISTLEEFMKAKKIVDQLKKELNITIDIPLGVMIEVPSAALIADRLAKHVDFFSIGTNDLVQYTLASDRTNQSVSDLYQPFHPSVLRLIKMVTDASKKHKIECGVCGEMASDTLAIPLLLSLGVDTLSMMPSHILRHRYLISKINVEQLKLKMNRILRQDDEKKVMKYLKKTIEMEGYLD